MENSKIQWTDNTFNPVVGCVRVSPGCDHCYAEAQMRRYGKPELWEGQRRRTTPSNWLKPIKWDREARHSGQRIKVFCASLSDVFDNGWEPEWRQDLWALIRKTPFLDWQLLTKRPENIVRMLPNDWDDGWTNVWLGTTVESSQYRIRASKLLQVPGNLCRRFISYEPAIGPFGKLSDIWIKGDTPKIDWLICGGESGPGARPMPTIWARDIRNQCYDHGIAFFMKQTGSNRDATWPEGITGKGDNIHQWPADLQIRHFPTP